MDNGQQSGTSSNVAVEDIESGEAPTGEPQEDIISSGEHPQPGQCRIGENAGTVRDVAPELLRSCVTARRSTTSTLKNKALEAY